VIYLYAITEPDAALPGAPGLEDRPLSLLGADDVAGLYSEHERAAFEPDVGALWRHDQVVEAAMTGGPVLPARFGTTFADPSALSDVLERDQRQLRRALDRVRGCVELAVRVSAPASPTDDRPGGREYVETKLARRRELGALTERTLVPLSAHAVSFRHSGPSGDSSTLTASYLVRTGEVDRFAEQVRQLADRHDELSVSCTGPWPPYSFVGDEPA
jgi:hypothetical protein